MADLMSRSETMMVDFVRRHRVERQHSVRPIARSWGPPVLNGPRPPGAVVVRGGYVQASGPHHQRVIFKASYRMSYSGQRGFATAMSKKIGYLSRGGCIEIRDENGKSLTLEEAKEKLREWKADDRYYDLMFSADESRRMDLHEFTRRTMDKLNEDVTTPLEKVRGAKVEYLVVEHWDTKHPHTQVMMRAKLEDKELRLSNGYVSHGLRARAEQVATGMVGYKIERELTDEQRREKSREGERLLREGRIARGLDPATGKHPDENKTEEGGKGIGKARAQSRDAQGKDGNERDGGIG